jgi:hypothetical protein
MWYFDPGIKVSGTSSWFVTHHFLPSFLAQHALNFYLSVVLDLLKVKRKNLSFLENNLIYNFLNKPDNSFFAWSLVGR